MENYTFKSNGHTYKTENAIRVMTTTIFDEFFSDVVEVVLWRTEDGLYYFTLEDIVGEGDFAKTVHHWAADPNDVRYWMGKNEIELADFVDERVEKDKALYEAIRSDLCPDDD